MRQLAERPAPSTCARLYSSSVPYLGRRVRTITPSCSVLPTIRSSASMAMGISSSTLRTAAASQDEGQLRHARLGKMSRSSPQRFACASCAARTPSYSRCVRAV